MSILLGWLLSLWLALVPAPLFASASAYAGAGTNDFTVGQVTWTGISNCLGATDGLLAQSSVTTANTTTYYLKLTSFGFSIPAGATINGVQASIYAKYIDLGSFDATVKWNAVKLVDAAGNIGSTDNDGDATLPTNLSSPVLMGGAADLWGGDASIDWNDSDAGIVLSTVTVGATDTMFTQVDSVQLIITYTEAGAGGGIVPRRRVIGRARHLTTSVAPVVAATF